MQPIIELEKVSKYFGGITALCYVFIFLGAIFTKIDSFIGKYK